MRPPHELGRGGAHGGGAETRAGAVRGGDVEREAEHRDVDARELACARQPQEAHIDDIMEAEGVDAIDVTQWVCRPFTLMRLLPGTPHRGIANRRTTTASRPGSRVDRHWHALRERTTFTLHEEVEFFADWQE